MRRFRLAGSPRCYGRGAIIEPHYDPERPHAKWYKKLRNRVWRETAARCDWAFKDANSFMCGNYTIVPATDDWYDTRILLAYDGTEFVGTAWPHDAKCGREVKEIHEVSGEIEKYNLLSGHTRRWGEESRTRLEWFDGPRERRYFAEEERIEREKKEAEESAMDFLNAMTESRRRGMRGKEDSLLQLRALGFLVG